MVLLWLILIVPGLVCGYAFFVRPILRAVPQLKGFYAEADGFWAKIWAVCGKSATMAWSYIMALIGSVMQAVEPIASMLGDPDVKQQVTDALGANPQLLGYVLMGISAVTIASRLRSLAKAD
jgi:hypothetical protein